jgi:hypothetical protein
MIVSSRRPNRLVTFDSISASTAPEHVRRPAQR